jgi:hypothetical protein
MPVRAFVLLATLMCAPVIASAQARAAGPQVTGTWRVAAGTDVKSGPREVIIRADSSASWGKETVRWRVRDGKIWIALGGEWEIYTLRVTTRELTLSGGDLQKPVTLQRVGPPSPLPTGARVPPDPDVG